MLAIRFVRQQSLDSTTLIGVTLPCLVLLVGVSVLFVKFNTLTKRALDSETLTRQFQRSFPRTFSEISRRETEVHSGRLRLEAVKQLRRGARPLALRLHSVALLRSLTKHPGQRVTKEELLQQLWPRMSQDALREAQRLRLLPPWKERKRVP